jgi:hypothetical protein
MSFFEPPTPMLDKMFATTLPEVACVACRSRIGRRANRVTLRASWREATESICPECWHQVCDWAARFALSQCELPF